MGKSSSLFLLMWMLFLPSLGKIKYNNTHHFLWQMIEYKGIVGHFLPLSVFEGQPIPTLVLSWFQKEIALGSFQKLRKHIGVGSAKGLF